MLLVLAVALLTVTVLALAVRRRRLRVALERLGPGRMVIYSKIARSRRW